MNNDLTNELNTARGDRLHNLVVAKINSEVKAAIDSLAPGAMNALQGLNASDDGITASLWRQAVSAAEMDGSLTFPEYRDGSGIHADAEVVSYGQAMMVVAGRVARAILHVNGFVSPFIQSEPGSFAGGPDDNLHPSAYYNM